MSTLGSSHLLSTWKRFRHGERKTNRQSTAFGLMSESNIFDFHELRQDFSLPIREIKTVSWIWHPETVLLKKYQQALFGFCKRVVEHKQAHAAETQM
jgi:hypothetical protein